MDELKQELIDAIESADFEVTEDYSGRGMFGKRCIGFVAPNPLALAQVVAYIYDEDQRHQIADKATYDNMGTDVIIYFPTLEN